MKKQNLYFKRIELAGIDIHFSVCGPVMFRLLDKDDNLSNVDQKTLAKALNVMRSNPNEGGWQVVAREHGFDLLYWDADILKNDPQPNKVLPLLQNSRDKRLKIWYDAMLSFSRVFRVSKFINGVSLNNVPVFGELHRYHKKESSVRSMSSFR